MQKKKMSKETVNKVVEEWAAKWKLPPDSAQHYRDTANRGPHCVECGIPCNSHGFNENWEPVCIYCKRESGEWNMLAAPAPTHGIPYYVYVKKHRDYCKQFNHCDKCNCQDICSRLDRDLSTFL